MAKCEKHGWVVSDMDCPYCTDLVRKAATPENPLDGMVSRQDVLSGVRSLKLLPEILNEAAGNLRALMETKKAEEICLRHFLPDELEGSALMLAELFDRIDAETE